MPKRGNNIYKRKDGRWEARYVKGISADGKKLYGSVYGKTYTEAKDKQSLFIHDHLTTHKLNSISLSSLMHEWLNHIENTVKRSTYQKYCSIVKNHIDTSIIGTLPVRYLSAKSYSDYTKSKLDSGLLSAKTVNDIVIIIGLSLSYAEEVYGIKKPKLQRVKESKKEMRVLSIPEQKKLEQYLYYDMNLYHFGVLLALYTGIRIGELCALQWDDIRSDCIVITKTMHRIQDNDRTIIEITEPKTPSSIRTIPIPAFLQPIIDAYHQPKGYVLVNRNGKFVEPRLMQLNFKRMVGDCELPKTNFHALRHTFATRCIEAGFDVKSLSEILGHADVNTTLNKYVHSSFELKQENMKRLKPIVNL
ncbi:MAG: site-specific integrase [Ruminococcus sp.]|nr:site-specific integrase [Ruminococcus sp.]